MNDKSINRAMLCVTVKKVVTYLMHIMYLLSNYHACNYSQLKLVLKSNKRLDLSTAYILFNVHFLANLHDNHVRRDRY